MITFVMITVYLSNNYFFRSPSCSNLVANPKSPILTCKSSFKNKLPNFKSL